FSRHPDARAVADAGRDPDVNRARLTVVLDREPPRRPVIDVFEGQFDLLLDVASGPRLRSAAPSRPPAAPARFLAGSSARGGLEEIRERVVAPEHLVHFFLGHRPVAALAAGSAAEVHVESAELTGIEAGAARRGASLLVGAPVRAQFVVFLALRRIAEDLVGL